MALTDACFDFLHSVSAASEELARAVHHYSDPKSAIDYGSEIDALRQACAAVSQTPYDPEAGARLLRLAAAVMTFHDTLPDSEEASVRKSQMRKLVRLLQVELEGEDEASISAVVNNVVVETGYTQRAAERLKAMLPKLGKSAYDIAVKIIGDIGSATVKKILGI